MTEKKNSLWRLSLVLVIISAIASAALSLVYSITKENIERAGNRKRENAIAQVLPGFKGTLKDTIIRLRANESPVTVHLAYLDGKFRGAAVETYTDKGFNGTFTLMVGFNEKGEITGSEVLSAAETPGLGENIKSNKSGFSKQFIGKNPTDFQLKVKKDGGDVDAITAATISSRAYCDAVDRAFQSFLRAKETENE